MNNPNGDFFDLMIIVKLGNCSSSLLTFKY